MKNTFLIFTFLVSFLGFTQDFNEDILKEIENVSKVSKVKSRSCNSNGIQIKINENAVESTREIDIITSSPHFSKTRKYYVYDESAEYILADNLNLTDLEHAKRDFTPELIILKKGKQALILEGLGSKFLKKDNYSNCETGSKSINNLRCNFRVKKGRLENYKNLQSFNDYFSFTQNLKTRKAPPIVRDLASLMPNQDLELKFTSVHKHFHSGRVKVGMTGDQRTGVLINSEDVVSLTFSHPKSSLVLQNCNLSL